MRKKKNRKERLDAVFYDPESVRTVILLYFDGRDIVTITNVTGINMEDVEKILDDFLI